MRLRNILILLVVLLVLGGFFYIDSRPKPSPPPKPQLYVWLVEMEELKHITIELPRDNKSQAFSKREDRFWYFDESPQPKVDMQRWGGGIPLLLSGPGTNKIISENATGETLARYGLTQPAMQITLTLESGKVLDIKVGDSTPDGSNFYVQAPGSNDVALVDYTWFQVLARLVNDPPYPPPPAK